MGFYERQVLPRIVDIALGGAQFDRLRARATSGLAGEVLEVGFGSGRNLAHYPASVTGVVAVDPATVGRALAAPRIADRRLRVDHIGLDGEHLPLDDASVDHALSTWTLCTIPDVDQALREISRALRPGGTLHFVEHGRAPDPKVRRWQDRLTPIQRRVAGGCHLNRPIDQLIDGAGFEVVALDTRYIPGPKAFGYTYLGVARKPAARR